jgi:hypothetical protein
MGFFRSGYRFRINTNRAVVRCVASIRAGRGSGSPEDSGVPVASYRFSGVRFSLRSFSGLRSGLPEFGMRNGVLSVIAWFQQL